MAIVEKMLAEGAAPATTTTAYTVPENTQTKITKAQAQNGDTANRTLKVYLVASGGSASDTTNRLVNLTLAAGESVTLTEVMFEVLASGATIQHVADVADKVAVRYNGKETGV